MSGTTVRIFISLLQLDANLIQFYPYLAIVFKKDFFIFDILKKNLFANKQDLHLDYFSKYCFVRPC